MDIGGKPAEVEVFLAGLDPKGVGAALDIGGKPLVVDPKELLSRLPKYNSG